MEVDATQPLNYGNSAAAVPVPAARVVADAGVDADGVAAVQSKRQQQKLGDSGPPLLLLLPLLSVSQRTTSVQTDVWATIEVAAVVGVLVVADATEVVAVVVVVGAVAVSRHVVWLLRPL